MALFRTILLPTSGVLEQLHLYSYITYLFPSRSTIHNLHYEKFQDGTAKCIEEEIPFEVPEGWEWCRLNAISQFELGKTLDTAKNTGQFHKYLRSINIRWNKVDLSDVKEMKFEDNELERYSIHKGDFLICEGGDVGRCCVWEEDDDIYYQNALHRVRFYKNLNPYFYMYIMMSYTLSGKLQEICKGVTIKHLTRTTLLTLLFPVPPFQECQRIADNLSNYILQLNEIKAKETEISLLVQNTKSKILDLAIQGKLVPQNPNDEPASTLLERIRNEKESLIKAGKIKRGKKESIIYRGDDNSYYEKFTDGSELCIDDEISYPLPMGWEYCRLNCIVQKEIKRGKAPKYSENSDTLVFAQKCNRKTGEIDLSLAQYLDESILGKYPPEEYLQQNDIVINSTGTGTLGRVGFFSDIDTSDHSQIVPDSHVTTIRVSSYIQRAYAYIFVKHLQPYLEGHGEGSTNQKELKPDTLKNLIISVPPVSEQCRIVGIVKAVLNSLNEIEATLI